MKARLFHATVVFLLTFVFSTLSVYAQDEDILIEPPLTWSINSIQLVWSVSQGATTTQETKKIYGTDQVNSETFGKERDTENGTTTGLSASGGARIDGSAGMEYNPLKGFGLLGAKVNASAYVEGGFNYNRTNRTTNTTQWSESEKNIVSQALTSAFQQSSQQTISNQRLVFTVDFVNHTDSQLEFDPRYNNGIPIFLGNTNIGKATPVGIKEAIISIPATGEPVPIEFEMPLDDSRKLTLLKDNRPLISINKGQLFFRTSVDEPEIEGNIFRKSLVATSYFTVAILSGNEVKEWKIRFDEDSPVTVKEALDAINKSNRKKQNTSKSVFSIKNNHFISVCKAPFSSENNSEWITELKVYKDEDEQTVDISDPDSCLTDTPQMGDRYIFQLVSQEIKKLKARGKAGDAEAIFELAKKYFNGDGVPEDKVKAVKLYRKAAEQGNAESQFKLGVCYMSGEGVPQDKSEAVKWYRKAAEQDFPKAQFCLGLCYMIGNGVSQDKIEGINWYSKAAEQGYIPAQITLGNCYFYGINTQQNFAEAVKWYRKPAEQGNAAAQYHLGLCYEKGNGAPEDKSEAVKWYRKSAEQGYSFAQYKLGICYYHGNDVPEDISESAKWFRKAAEQGHSDAQFILGLYYYEGDGVSKDESEAAKWYRKAAEQGHSEAQFYLGLLYYNGNGVPEDKVEAVKWYRKAAEQGYAKAQFRLGWCYDSGKGIPQNYTEAVKWYRKAAEQEHAEAQFSLGVCYIEGEGVSQNTTEAVKWFRKAAEQGFANAQYNLGVAYMNGDGAPYDYSEAIKWFRKAAEQGQEDAINALKKRGISY
ncbi:MAG: SEL1-like repeat protein [Thermoguttaceae bacterium]|nr:SEL1-like repeat protein [Thermoguttaceae bacterium]